MCGGCRRACARRRLRQWTSEAQRRRRQRRGRRRSRRQRRRPRNLRRVAHRGGWLRPPLAREAHAMEQRGYALADRPTSKSVRPRTAPHRARPCTTRRTCTAWRCQGTGRASCRCWMRGGPRRASVPPGGRGVRERRARRPLRALQARRVAARRTVPRAVLLEAISRRRGRGSAAHAVAVAAPCGCRRRARRAVRLWPRGGSGGEVPEGRSCALRLDRAALPHGPAVDSALGAGGAASYAVRARPDASPTTDNDAMAGARRMRDLARPVWSGAAEIAGLASAWRDGRLDGVRSAAGFRASADTTFADAGPRRRRTRAGAILRSWPDDAAATRSLGAMHWDELPAAARDTLPADTALHRRRAGVRLIGAQPAESGAHPCVAHPAAGPCSRGGRAPAAPQRRCRRLDASRHAGAPCRCGSRSSSPVGARGLRDVARHQYEGGSWRSDASRHGAGRRARVRRCGAVRGGRPQSGQL